jgi:GST-like protein
VLAHRRKLWLDWEAEVEPKPWALGERFSALDIYIAAMTHWRPRRPWFEQHCPKLFSVARAADALPRLAPVWARNFGTG